MRALLSGTMTERQATKVLRDIKSRLKTSTKNVILNDRGYIFDEHLSSAGQARSSLYYVFKGAGVYCGKVYHPGEVASMTNEKTVSEAVHRDQHWPTLIKVIDAFHAGRHAVLILPLLAKSAADLLVATAADVGDEATAYVCMGVLAAMAGLASNGWCHGDIKPANIMLTGDQKRVVLVDLGACTRVPELLTEFTKHYALGLPNVAGLQWDLACLASTLCLLGGIMVAKPLAHELKEELRVWEGSLSFGGQLALHILEHLDGVNTVEKLREDVWDKVMERVRDQLGEEHAATLASWWP
ncbi:hypothetical protein GPECTOR_76g779 [Gonium pectorale]|uniref:Protein kinase domain-containing protein n=1 Tax=Gonium pectorale TaxID=33097 RepID=A0A150G290_GONPE|nr:hypothetical protein GPECTOR_76g779 [Gonium pectorale]|eukprot:KXZ43958.1 hypothetical protein GPECTOR_76g779 [Gonium pectorale]